MRRSGTFVRSLFVRPERFFIAAGSVFGILLLFLIPPLQDPDEQVHFLRAYQISQFYLVSNNRNGVPGDNLPKSLNDTIGILSTPQIRFNSNLKYDLHHTKAALKVNLDKHDSTFVGVIGTSSYAPVGYIPQAVFVGIASVFNTPPVILIYIARIGSLIAWLGLLFATIKVIPYRKWTVVGIALLPMMVAQAGSSGVDAVSIGLAALFIATVLRLRSLASVTKKQWVLLLVLASLIALTKQTTLLVIGFIFLLPATYFDTNKRAAIIKKVAVFTIPILCLVLWTVMTMKLHLNSASGVPGQDLHGQLATIIHNPLRFPGVIFNTFFLTWGDNVIQSFAGVFGWTDTPLSEGIIVIIFIYIAYLLLRTYEQTVTKQKKIVAITSVSLLALYTLATLAALYLLYSPVNFDVIYGLQGRYFLLALFIALPLCQLLQKTTDVKNYAMVVRIMTPTLLICSALTIYLRFYVKLF